MITTVYRNTQYRIHKTGCKDIAKEFGTFSEHHTTSLLEIAKDCYADFLVNGEIDEGDALGYFLAESTILPCTNGILTD